MKLLVTVDLDAYKRILADRGLSHTAAAQKAGLSNSTLKILHGKGITPRTLNRLAAALEVQPSSLIQNDIKSDI